jgi:hypothetical protein
MTTSPKAQTEDPILTALKASVGDLKDAVLKSTRELSKLATSMEALTRAVVPSIQQMKKHAVEVPSSQPEDAQKRTQEEADWNPWLDDFKQTIKQPAGRQPAGRPKSSAEMQRETKSQALAAARTALPAIVRFFSSARSNEFSFAVTEGTAAEPKRLYFGWGLARTAEISDTPSGIMFKKHGQGQEEEDITDKIDAKNLKKTIEEITKLMKGTVVKTGP